MYKRRILEIALQELALREPGGGDGTHIATARLIWPRPAIAEKVAIKTLVFRDGHAELTGSAEWASRILFKETVQGPCSIEIAVTRAVADSQTARFLHAVYSSALSALASNIGLTGSAGSWIGLPQAALRYVGKEAGSPPKDWPSAVAGGCGDFPAQDMPVKGKTASVVLPLTAPEDLYETRRRRRQGELHLRRERVLKAGEANGEAVLKITAYD